MGQCCCCAPCCYFRGWPLHHYLHHRDFFFSFLRCWRICVDGCGDGEQKEKELGLGWEMRGDLAKWVTATGRADKRLTSTYANVRSRTRAVPRTHNKTETVLSCVPTASFPCKAPKIKPAQPAGSTKVLHFAPLLRTPGLEERHKALPKYHKGASLVLPHLSCPLGRQPFTWISCYTSHTRNKVLAGIWTWLVTQASHSPAPTNLTPPSGEPPADIVNIQHWYKMEIDANFVVAVHQFTLVVIATLDEYISYFNLNIFKHFHTLWLIRTSHNHLSLRDP